MIAARGLGISLVITLLSACSPSLPPGQATLQAACTAYLAAVGQAIPAIRGGTMKPQDVASIAAGALTVLGPPGQPGGGICTSPLPSVGLVGAAAAVSIETARITDILTRKDQ